MDSSSDARGLIIAALMVCLVYFLLGCICVIIGIAKVHKEKSGRRTRVWYSRFMIIVGFAIIVYELGQGIPNHIVSLVVFHGSLVPGTSEFGSQVHQRFNFLNGFAFISQVLCLALTVWAGVVGILERRKSNKQNSLKTDF